MLAQRQAIKILRQKAVERVDERFEGYRSSAVKTLKAIIDAQARFETSNKRHNEVLAELEALAAQVSKSRTGQ